MANLASMVNLEKTTAQGNKKTISKSKIINKIATNANLTGTLNLASENGSKPHSYADNWLFLLNSIIFLLGFFLLIIKFINPLQINGEHANKILIKNNNNIGRYC